MSTARHIVVKIIRIISSVSMTMTIKIITRKRGNEVRQTIIIMSGQSWYN